MTGLDPTLVAARMTADAFWEWMTSKGALILVTLVGAIALRWLVIRSIDRVVRSTVERAAERDRRAPRRASRVIAEAAGLAHERHRQRATTTGALLKSTTTFVISVLTILTIMGTLGLPLAPLLASAGVGGVAIGFGAQSLVKDFLSGIFMIIEDQYGVGDIIDTGEAIGTVEDVSLRVTTVRDGTGVVWYIRNGEIVRIGNRSQGWSTALVDIPVAYDEDINRVLPLLRTVMTELDLDESWNARLLEEPEVVGVEAITAGSVTIRIIAKCAANENFAVSREILERSKAALDRAGVRAPLPIPPYGGRPA